MYFINPNWRQYYEYKEKLENDLGLVGVERDGWYESYNHVDTVFPSFFASSFVSWSN